MNKKKTSNKKAVKKTVRKAAARPAAKRNVKTKAAKGKAAPPKRAAAKKTRPHAKPAKKSKQDQTPASMRKTVGAAVLDLLAEKSDATFDEALAAAKAAVPSTKMSRKSFAWYRCQFKREHSS